MNGLKIAELREVAARLVTAREQLAAIDRDGPCDPSCAFLGQGSAAGARCCRFLEIRLHLGEPPTLEVPAPEGALALVHELFGEPGA